VAAEGADGAAVGDAACAATVGVAPVIGGIGVRVIGAVAEAAGGAAVADAAGAVVVGAATMVLGVGVSVAAGIAVELATGACVGTRPADGKEQLTAETVSTMQRHSNLRGTGVSAGFHRFFIYLCYYSIQ
jgi:hypothetical protein